MSERCTCTDCAVNNGHIEKHEGTYTDAFIVHTPTKAHEAAGEYEGDECSLDHNHEASKSCALVYICDSCGEHHDEENEAVECCITWECNFCGSTFSDSWWGSPRSAAASCCVMGCDDCGEMGWPDWLEDHSCAGSKGMRRQLPWEARGIVVDARQPVQDKYYEQGTEPWRATWGFDPESLDVVQAAADYYLLEAITAGLVGTTDGKGGVNGTISSHPAYRIVRNEAQALMNSLVDVWDEVLMNYTHMAVGGELRHHQSVGGEVLSGNRDVAWVGWKQIFEAVGPDSLVDANELFLEFGGGSFGGKPWGDACLILHARLTGKISRQMFLDRIFNHQHNGGNFLNKVTWAGDRRRAKDYYAKDAWSLSDMTHHLLPAHGAEPEPNYPILLAYASPAVRTLFSDAYEMAGHAARDMGVSLSFRSARPLPGRTKAQEKALYNAQQEAKAKAYYEATKVQKLEQKLEAAKEHVESYKGYHAQMVKDNEAAKAKLNDPTWKCNCGYANCSAQPIVDTYSENYYAEMVEHYEQSVVDISALLAEAQAEEAAKKAPLTIDWPDDDDDDEPCSCCSGDYDDDYYFDDEPF